MKRAAAVVALVVACGPGSARRPSDGVAIAPVASVPLVVEPGPVVAAGVAPVEIAVNASQLCARVEGHVHCGVDATPPFVKQPAIGGIDDAVSVSLGTGFGCVATKRGSVHCWGDNRVGQLGAGIRDESRDVPVQVVGVTNAKRVVAGPTHACAILEGGAVRCWGDNEHGATGSATTYRANVRDLVVATAVPSISNVVSIAATVASTCAITGARETWCWGEAVLGDATNEPPRRVSELASLEDVAGSDRGFCGIRAGHVLCWGMSFSLFGNFRGRAAEPVSVDVPRARRVRVSDTFACAIGGGESRVYCWGSNTSGALGRSTAGDAFATYPPALVDDSPRAADLAVGGGTACAITDSGEVSCWGRLPLTDNPVEIAPSPVHVHVFD